MLALVYFTLKINQFLFEFINQILSHWRETFFILSIVFVLKLCS